ncbi:hypothetical protein, conserved [Plasmodium gonderi]|uniref:TFIIS N-terminal domain-containing protein n=1 Tax=Plasmodium gonderi TaxID=77519 RepID=A0A1Y1JGS4_PLAGO|nr:hypothetical protein, conserved [Plasmodium gonderi]GAW80858.1 hypothetical protein, conserved [Plasmodium gonderi]
MEENSNKNTSDECAKISDLFKDENRNIENFKKKIKENKRMVPSRKKKREIKDADSEEEEEALNKEKILKIQEREEEEGNNGVANSEEDQELDNDSDEKDEYYKIQEEHEEEDARGNNLGKKKRKSKLKRKIDQEENAGNGGTEQNTENDFTSKDNIFGDQNFSDESQGSKYHEEENNDNSDNRDNDDDDDDYNANENSVKEKRKKKKKKKLLSNKDKKISDGDNMEVEDEGKKRKKEKLIETTNSKFIDSVAEEGEEATDEDESEDDTEEYEEEDLSIDDKDVKKNKKKKRSRNNENFNNLSILDDERGYDNDVVDSNKSEKKKKSHFDEILENLKMKRKRVQKISEDDGLQYCENVLNQMILMHEQDVKNMKEKKPATAKLQTIDQVCKILTKPKWKPFFMKLNIYHVLALWLMPTSKNTLPNFTIRTNLLKVIQQLPITIKSLRGSQLGKIMTYLHTHKEETEENKKLIRSILQNWMGPIIGINTNYKQFLKERQKRILENPEYHKKVLEKAKTLIPDSICIEKEEEQNEFKRHATIPFNSECSFLINVPSSVPSSSKKILPKSKIKRLTDNMKLLKRARKSQKVSIEGKGIAM